MFWFKYVEFMLNDIIVKGGRLILEAETAYAADCRFRSVEAQYTGICLCKNIYGPYPTREKAEKVNQRIEIPTPYISFARN